MPQSVFYPNIRNEGITSHFNTTASILTGNWQRVDAWGKLRPTTPTIFEFLRKDSGLAAKDVWLVSSNKALTRLIGASSAQGYGSAFGANVVFPKQLLINAVETAIQAGRMRSLSDRAKAQDEIENALQGNNYEGLGWNVFDGSSELDPSARSAHDQRSNGPFQPLFTTVDPLPEMSSLI